METDSFTFAPKKHPFDIIVVILLGLVAAATAIVLPDGNAFRVVMSIPLLMLYPGYAMVSALWPRNNLDGNSIDILARVAMSIGLSIVLMSLTGLLLSFTVGLNTNNVLAGNIILLLIWSGIAIFRRSILPVEKRFSPITFGSAENPAPKGMETVIMALAVAGIVICSGFVSYAVFRPTAENTYTEFYILDANRTTKDYPLNMTVNETASVIVAVQNHESDETNYVMLSGAENATGRTYINDWSNPLELTNTTVYATNITLSAHSGFDDEFLFYFTEPGLYKVSWQLQIDGAVTEYEVHLWITVNPA